MLIPFFDRRKSYHTKASEFWPPWVLQTALYGQGIPLGLWSGGLTWFARVNPGMAWGGMLAYSKSAAMASLPPGNKAAELAFNWPMPEQDLLAQLHTLGLAWPMVLKPDQGERGRDVYRLSCDRDLQQKLSLIPPGEYLLQEFLELPFEFGVFVSKSTQTDRFEVLSLTWKVPLGVMGDGVSTVTQLLAVHARAQRFPQLLATFSATLLQTVPPAGEWQALHFSGNHCCGAAFIDANALINADLHQSMHQLLKDNTGFRFGRLDVLVADPQALWEPTAIKVIEINGANAEPAHIYDPAIPFLKTLLESLRFQRLMWQQARWMQLQGTPAPPLSMLWPVFKSYRAQMRSAVGR